MKVLSAVLYMVCYITLCAAKAHSVGEIQPACQIVQRTVLDTCLGTRTNLNWNGDLFEEKKQFESTLHYIIWILSEWCVMIEGMHDLHAQDSSLLKEWIQSPGAANCLDTCYFSISIHFFPFSCGRLCVALMFLPDFRCGLCEGQIILWELFCLKPLFQPKQTGWDKKE